MKLKPHKRAPVDIDRGIQDRNTSQSPSKHERVPSRIMSVSATTPSAGIREVSDQEWDGLSAEIPTSHVRESISEKKRLGALLPRLTKIWSTRSGRP